MRDVVVAETPARGDWHTKPGRLTSSAGRAQRTSPLTAPSWLLESRSPGASVCVPLTYISIDHVTHGQRVSGAYGGQAVSVLVAGECVGWQATVGHTDKQATTSRRDRTWGGQWST